jgi:hypothetical protein
MLKNIMRALCSDAGWQVPQADEHGRYAFFLEGDLRFTLSSPDGERLLAHAILLAPEPGPQGPAISPEILASVMTITAGRFSRLRAVTALDPETGSLVLYRLISLKDNGQDDIKDFVESFLNELAFWKAQPLVTSPRGPTESFFSRP